MLAFWRRHLLAGDYFARTFSRARVGVRPLSAHRKPATMPDAAVASEIHQAFDRLLKIAAQIAFDFVVGVDHLPDVNLLIGGEIVSLDRGIDFRRCENLERARPAYAVNVGERDIHPLVFREFDSSYSCHRETLPSLGAACGAGWSTGCARRLRDAPLCSSYRSFLLKLLLSFFSVSFSDRSFLPDPVRL